MRYLLIGNPNSGKTTLFNRLTSSSERTGNWHGVTVESKEKTVEGDVFCDVPGIYSLIPTSPEEISAIRSLQNADVILNVIDAENLARGLKLTRELKGYNVIVLVTMTEEWERKGGTIDLGKMQERLGVPVLTTDKKKGKTLRREIKNTSARPIKEAFEIDFYHEAPMRENAFERTLFSPYVSLACFFAFVFLAFFLTFSEYGIGAFLKGLIESSISSLAKHIVAPLPIRSFFVDGLLLGIGSVLSFLPQILLLELFLRLMEESGFLSIFAYAGDPILRKIGLNGRSLFSLLMGFGCTATAIRTVKAHDNEAKRRLISIFPYLSCSAKMPVYVTLFSSFFVRPFVPVLFMTGLGVVFGFVSMRRRNCNCSSAVFEVASLRIPNANNVLKSLFFSAKSFIIKLAGIILTFIMVSWFFSSFDFSMHFVSRDKSMLASFCDVLRILFIPMGMGEWEVAYAFFSGIVAKENVAGMLTLFYPSGLPFSFASVFSFGICILTTSPCVSSVITLSSLIGRRGAIVWFLKQLLIGLMMGYYSYACFLCPYLLILPVLGVLLEGIYRKRKTIFKRVHG